MRELLSRIWKKDEGFSLIELIIVIAILAIIAAIAVPNLMNNINKANKSADESNAKIVADAVLVSVGSNIDWQATTLTNMEFDTDTTAPIPTDQAIINDAIDQITGGAPALKSDEYGTKATNFYVNLDPSTGIITVSGYNGTTYRVIYPQ